MLEQHNRAKEQYKEEMLGQDPRVQAQAIHFDDYEKRDGWRVPSHKDVEAAKIVAHSNS